MIAMAGERLSGEPLIEQMEQEGCEALDDALPEGDIAVLCAPALRPAFEVRTQLGERLGCSHRRHNRRRVDYSFLHRHAFDSLAQRLPPLSRIRL